MSSESLSSQSISISGSNPANSPIASIEQIEHNFRLSDKDVHSIMHGIQNHAVEFLQSDSSEEKERIEKIKKFEESLRAEFKEKLDKAALFVNDLSACIKYRLTDGNPKDDATILRLLDELQSILGKESRLKDISEDLEFCYEGGIWLQKNKSHVARCAKGYIFKQQNTSDLLKEAHSKLTVREIERRFLQDIETYISWISIYLKTGKTPKSKDFKDGIFSVHLDLPQSVYKEAFEALNADVVNPIFSKLSIGAANNAASYFNRFIIDRDLSKDAEISASNKFSSIFPELFSSEISQNFQGDLQEELDSEEELIADCLLDPAFDFRTVLGISAATGIPKTQVHNVLENAAFVRKSMVSAKNGEALYTHRRHRPSLREWLAATQRILSNPFLSTN